LIVAVRRSAGPAHPVYVSTDNPHELICFPDLIRKLRLLHGRSFSRWLDRADWSKGFGDGEDVPAWTKRVGELGLDTSSKVIVYDDIAKLCTRLVDSALLGAGDCASVEWWLEGLAIGQTPD